MTSTTDETVNILAAFSQNTFANVLPLMTSSCDEPATNVISNRRNIPPATERLIFLTGTRLTCEAAKSPRFTDNTTDHTTIPIAASSSNATKTSSGQVNKGSLKLAFSTYGLWNPMMKKSPNTTAATAMIAFLNVIVVLFLNTCYSLFVIGYWLLVIRYSLLVIRYSLFVIGYWFFNSLIF